MTSHNTHAATQHPTIAPSMIPPPKRAATRTAKQLVLLAVLIGLAVVIWTVLDRPVLVKVTRAIAKESGASFAGTIVQAPGWVEARPYPILVPGLIEGTIASVLAIEGDTVKAGQVLATLDDKPHQEMAREAAAAYQMARAEEAQARLNLTLAEARMQVGEASRLDVELAAAEVGKAESATLMAKAKADLAELNHQRCVVASPTDGVVYERRVDPGERLGMEEANGGALFSLFDPASVQVRADIPLADAGSVAPGQKAEITVDAFKDRVFTGTVLVGGFRADVAKNTLQVKVAIDQPDGLLRPDTLTRVRVMVPGGGGTGGRVRTLIPASHAFDHEGSRMALVIGDDGRLTEVMLDGATDAGDGWLAVEAGVRPGDLVVHPEHRSLTPGTRVEPMEAQP